MEKRMERFVNGKLLRCGYTTGSCAAGAAKAAVQLLLTGAAPAQVALKTPGGVSLTLDVLEPFAESGRAQCAIRKDGGDDPDVTNGTLIYARAQKTDGAGVLVDGGQGVGRVTKPGLDQPVGAAAINHVPRRMIEEAARCAASACGYGGGLAVVVFVPEGERLAKKTFNPHLGITGGISILGTSGIVEPMSDQAIVDTIGVEARMAAAGGAKRLILAPGNYGLDYLKKSGMLGAAPVVKCSNFIGQALDIAALNHFEQVLLVGHVGKLAKLAGGIMNTHSRWADCRTELFCAHAAVCGADTDTCRALMYAATTDACIAILDEAHLRGPVMESMLAAIGAHLTRRAADAYAVGAMLFSNAYGLLGTTEGASAILTDWKGEKT